MFINRDAKRYETIRAKRREAVQKRWAKQKNISNNESVEEDTNVYKSIHSDTPQYLNDNENDNVNENDNGNDNGHIYINKYLLTDNNARTRTREGQSAVFLMIKLPSVRTVPSGRVR